MKKVICLLLISACAIAVSCNDDDHEAAPELLPTKIEQDGITLMELIFDTDKKLIRINSYFNGQLDTYTLFEYSEEGIKESRRYFNSHTLNYKRVFILDNFGRVIKVENYTSQSDFEEVYSIFRFDYDPSGRLTKKHAITVGDPVNYVDEYTYDDNGVLIKQQRTRNPEQTDEYLDFLIENTPGNKPMPSHWNNIFFQLALLGNGSRISDMFYSSTHFTAWTSNGEISSNSRTDLTEQQENSDGYVTRQILTTESLINGTTSSHEMTYEYTK